MTLTAPALRASFVLSVAERTTLSPPMETWDDGVPSAIFIHVSASSTTTATEAATQNLPPSPLTLPARAWAARSPLYSSSMFWVSSDTTMTSPFCSPPAIRLPVMSVPHLLRSTLTATPTAMELELRARLMARPVPRVLKLPLLSERMIMSPEAKISPPMVTRLLWDVMFRPTAAATW